MHRPFAVLAVSLALLAACSNDDKDGQRVAAEGEAPVETTTSTTATTLAPETTTTTAAPTTTTAKPTTTTTARPTTTTTAIPASQARLTIVNDYPGAVAAVVNGVRHELAKGARKGPFGVQPGPYEGNDTIHIEVVADPSCGAADAEGYFQAGTAYTLRLYARDAGPCGAKNSPSLAGVVDPGGKQV